MDDLAGRQPRGGPALRAAICRAVGRQAVAAAIRAGVRLQAGAAAMDVHREVLLRRRAVRTVGTGT